MYIQSCNWLMQFIFYPKRKIVKVNIKPINVCSFDVAAKYTLKFIYSINSGFIFSCIPKSRHEEYIKNKNNAINSNTDFSFFFVVDQNNKNIIEKKLKSTSINITEKV